MALNWIMRNEANFSKWEQAQVFAITPPEYAFMGKADTFKEKP